MTRAAKQFRATPSPQFRADSRCRQATRGRTSRYVRDIIGMHRSLSYGRLVEHALRFPSAYSPTDRHGLTTVGFRTGDVPFRYLLGISGFRLAQYLAIGWASPDVVAQRALFSESVRALHPDDLHFVTLDSGTGEILGYLMLAGSSDPHPVSVRDFCARGRFPVEDAHGLDLFAAVDAPAGITTREVAEVKRFVHARWLDDAGRRLQISMELMLAVTRTLHALSPRIRVLIGDVEAKLAMRHLLMMGLDVTAVTGTNPQLADDHVLHPTYSARGTVEPFYADVPAPERIQCVAEQLEAVLCSPDQAGALREFLRFLRGSVRRVPAESGVGARSASPDLEEIA